MLCKINDVAMLGQAERYLKQAIVDREAYVASAALVSGMHLMKGSPAGVDIVRCSFILGSSREWPRAHRTRRAGEAVVQRGAERGEE